MVDMPLNKGTETETELRKIKKLFEGKDSKNKLQDGLV